VAHEVEGGKNLDLKKEGITLENYVSINRVASNLILPVMCKLISQSFNFSIFLFSTSKFFTFSHVHPAKRCLLIPNCYS
jgi:hypothetical protein